MTKQVLAQTGHRASNLRSLNSMDVAVLLAQIETSSVYGHLWLIHLQPYEDEDSPRWTLDRGKSMSPV